MLENQQILALESNKKIQKLENQLEEEKQLNYFFDTSSNDKQNVNVQKAEYFNQQKEWKQPTEVQHRDILKKKKDENLNEKPSAKDDKQFEEIDSESEEREEKPPKKGFWSRLFGN
ncbi:hypothetical protein SOJ_27640 [Staphylococcus sp. OJ82]|nr:hypothetical protein SOJ_27640 [Staphylococcus sp. OJ82]